MNNEKPVLSYKALFSYRNLWMLLALLWIMLFHGPGLLPGWGFLQGLKTYGYGGVDIFMFCSGIGCFFSLDKDADVLRFLKRRAWRLMPTYLIFLLFWFGYRALAGDLSAAQILGNFLGQGVLAGLDNQANWYVGCMWLCYLLAPLFVGLAREYKGALPRLGILAVISLLSLTFVGQFQLILWSRVPVFFLGVCMAQTGKDREGLTKRDLLLLSAAFLAGWMVLLGLGAFAPQSALWRYGLWWYPFALITPGLCVYISLLARQLSRGKARAAVEKATALGSFTFAPALIHVPAYTIYNSLVTRGLLSRSWWMDILVTGASLLASWAVIRLEKWLVKKIRK